MPRTYLVTGGTGFVGAAIVQRLAARGDRVRVLDNNFRGALRRLESVKDDVEFIDSDIRDTDSVVAAAKGVDSIIHLAFVNGTRFFYEKPELVLDVGVRGMLNVIEACNAHSIRELVLASSSEVYQSPPVIPTPESVPLTIPDILNPRYSYAAGKLISESIAINYGRSFDRVVIFRPHNVYGTDMGWEHVIPQLIVKILTAIQEQPDGRARVEIQGGGSQTRAFMYIDDCAEAVLHLLDRGEHLTVYHVGNPEEVRIEDVARLIAEHFGREIETVPTSVPKGETTRRCPDISRLESLGFSPATPLRAGLPPTVDWYAANLHLQPTS